MSPALAREERDLVADLLADPPFHPPAPEGLFCHEHAVPGCAECRPGLVEAVVKRLELVHVPVAGRCPTCRYPLPCTPLHTLDNAWRIPA